MTLNLSKIEERILKFWKKEKIFEKSLERTKRGKRFVFYEGPPFANGLPGIHHLLSRAFKDIILRYKTMRGFFVERRAGWDTHGLPTEMEAEKKLNIKSKREIERLGVGNFIDECKKNVFTYKKEWEEFSKRIGFWLDFENAYITCSNDYIESLWWILKQIYEKGLLYQDYKVVPYCPRCGTSLSSHEVAQGYKTIKENSIYVKFPVKEEKNTYFLIWTTTPWTLPGNVAIAVDKNFKYLKVKVGSDNLILAKQRLNILNEKYKIVDEFKGKDLLGREYQPLYSFIEPDKKAHYVVAGDFVSTEEGTGLVHMATAFGEDDMRIGKENDLPVLMTVDEEGRFKKPVSRQAGKLKNWAGMFVKEADPEIIEDLKKRKLLFKEEIYEHEYPFCWRCKTPLLYYAKESWFIKMTAVKKELIKNNKKINWLPDYIREGRFGEWLREIKDWNLSRERYWGTPLPIWKCKKCNDYICIGSLDELKKLQVTPKQNKFATGQASYKLQDLHRPQIDEIVLRCKCGDEMKRVPEVIDCWFDSGSMPFAQWHYPFENKQRIDKGEFYPADYISEGIDQTRGWFYTLLAVSTLLDFGPSYKNVVCHGLVLDSKGQKMSKSRGNIIVPEEVIDKFGADCARFYFYTINPEGEAKRFDFKDVAVLYRRFFDTLWQSYNFFSIYAEKNFKPKRNFQPKNLIDKWIISKLENLNFQVIKNLDNFNIIPAARLFKDFVDDLSNWYIRRSRKRFQKPETKKIKEEASQALYYVLLKLSNLLAPFTPFIAEELYQKLVGNDSVHLSSYSKPNEKLIDKKLEDKMKRVREVIVEALAQRAEKGIKVRQPLKKLKIKIPLSAGRQEKLKVREKELIDLIREEVNVKEIIFDNKIKKEVELDTKITEELKKEGSDREQIRNVNLLRKEAGLTAKDVAAEVVSTVPVYDIDNFLKETKTKNFRKVEKESQIDVDIKKEIKINGEKYYIGIKK